MTLQLPSNQLVTIPFCGLGTPTTDFILPPITGSDSSLTQTQEYGIPPVQQQNPAFGGKPVKRIETNGVLQFYSNVLYFINQGGQFTFDDPQSTALGGYSTGAVLFNFPTSEYVISLIDNNTFNFVTTPSYIDGVHWKTLKSLAYPDITDVAGAVSIVGAGGLNVTNTLHVIGAVQFDNDLTVNNHIACNTLSSSGNLGVGGTGIFGGSITVGINTIIGGFLLANQIAGRGGIIINTGGLNASYLGSNSTGAGGLNGFKFDDTLSRPQINNHALSGSVWDVVCRNDVNDAIPITQQFIGSGVTGGSFVLQATSTNGSFPCATGVSISGSINTGSPITPGTIKNYSIDLVGNGVISATPSTNGQGSSCMPALTGGLNYGIGGGCSYVNSLNYINMSGTNPSYSTASIIDQVNFNIIVR